MEIISIKMYNKKIYTNAQWFTGVINDLINVVQ